MMFINVEFLFRLLLFEQFEYTTMLFVSVCLLVQRLFSFLVIRHMSAQLAVFGMCYFGQPTEQTISQAYSNVGLKITWLSFHNAIVLFTVFEAMPISIISGMYFENYCLLLAFGLYIRGVCFRVYDFDMLSIQICEYFPKRNAATAA